MDAYEEVTRDPNLLIYATGNDGERVRVIDGVCRNAAGEVFGLYGGQTLASLTAQYGAVTVGTLDEYTALHDASWRSEPVAITADEYQNMLEVLPPVNWVKVGGVESFRMSEMTSGMITGIYARLGNTYWTFRDRIDLSPAAVAEKVKAAAAGLRQLGFVVDPDFE